MAQLQSLGLSKKTLGLLSAHGLTTVEELTGITARELLGMKGFGPSSLANVQEALEESGLSLAYDEFAPYECVRHGKAGWDVSLADLFLCEACAQRWQTEAFYDIDPEYVSAPLNGYCISCNHQTEVRLRHWLLCGNCERVARSIGRGVAAERFLSEQWDRLIAPHTAHVELRQTDEPSLRGRREGAPSKVAAIDFAVRDVRHDTDVFGLELKTGKKHLSSDGHPGGKMSEFQLDTTDCDDIRTVMAERGFPVYLVHVQVIDRTHPPTARYVPLDAWWTDPFLISSRSGFKRIQQRSRETRDAAYFSTTIFSNFSTFADSLKREAYKDLAVRLHNEGVPPLYHR